MFTTHTPVPAGHDRFDAGLVEEHIGPLREALGLSKESLMGLGRENPNNSDELFCMTVLALRLSRRANAVSALHAEVSRAMWTGLFKRQTGRRRSDRAHHERSARAVVAGAANVPPLRSPSRHRLAPAQQRSQNLAGHRKCGRRRTLGDAPQPEVAAIEFVRRRAVAQARRRGEPRETLQRLERVLSPDALTIGFARRFATYKRANLILTDIERLAAMVNDPNRPVQFVFAGKAHPLDEPGKKVLQQIAELMRDPKFRDKFVFVEDYDINVGRHFVQGVDVWLNNPRRPLEASGTSGQKVVLNGGLNLSILDGWWAEAFDGINGFAIGTGRTHSNMNVHDSRDGEDLMRTSARRSDSAVLPARSRRPAARLDQAHEADDPHSGLALQRRSHGDGLHAEELCSGGGRHFKRNQGQLVGSFSSL